MFFRNSYLASMRKLAPNSEKRCLPGKLRFTYNGNYGLEWPDLSVYDLMNAGEKLRVEELAGYYANKDDVGLQNYYNHLKQEVLRGVDTYWLGEPRESVFSEASAAI